MSDAVRVSSGFTRDAVPSRSAQEPDFPPCTAERDRYARDRGVAMPVLIVTRYRVKPVDGSCRLGPGTAMTSASAAQPQLAADLGGELADAQRQLHAQPGGEINSARRGRPGGVLALSPPCRSKSPLVALRPLEV